MEDRQGSGDVSFCKTAALMKLGSIMLKPPKCIMNPSVGKMFGQEVGACSKEQEISQGSDAE